MTQDPAYDVPPPGEVPTSAWVLGLSCLVGQVLQLVQSGPADQALSVALSVPVNVLVVVWVSAGVLAARRWRTVLAWVVLVIQVVFGAIGLAVDLDPLDLLSLLATTAAIASLAAFTRSDFHAWRAAHPTAPGPTVVGLLLLAGVVGAVAGVTDHSPGDDSTDGFELRVGT